MNKKEVTIKDLCYSLTAKNLGIDNTPDCDSQVNLSALIRYIVNPIFDNFPTACVTSGYRCHELNKEIGGVRNSQHTKGQAVDISIVIPGKTIKESIFELYDFVTSMLPFDQLIIYSTFVHISYKPLNRRFEVINKAPSIYTEIPKHFYLVTYIRR